MGNYNSYAPQILGQEWVPIRDENQIFSPAVNTVEVGHGFTLATPRILATGRFYIHDLPPAQVNNQVTMVAVYPRGFEDLSGPIRSVVIPCNSGGVTGNGFNSLTAANIPIFLANPSDGSYIECTPNADANTKHLELFFATNQYAQLLNDKRILAVNLLHSFSWDPIESGTGVVAPRDQVFTINQDLVVSSNAQLARFAPLVDYFGNNLMALNPPVGRPPQAIPMSVIHLGEIDHLWNTPTTTTERMPWRYPQLQRFEASAGTNRYGINYYFGGLTAWAGIFYLNYAALQVVYCEEQRLAYGAKAFGGSVGSTGTAQYVQGANPLTMRDTSLAANPTLPAGDYTVVASSPNIGDLTGPIASGTTQPAQDNTYPTLNAVRELYAMPAHPGVQVNIPTAVEDHLEETFSQVVTHILPQLSLHTSGGTMTEPHAYGRQIAAQVYGSNTAAQEIYDDIVGVNTVYQQVRFYARRFGDTSIPLALTGDASLAASSVSITPAEFDALTDIVDGWKEITLRFTTPPTMGTLVTSEPTWRWSAAGETKGNRWEILGACAPAISGVPGNLFNLVPAADQLYEATYQPPGGSIAELEWMPQGCGSPYVSGTTTDDSTDAFLIFSQDPPTVSGLTLNQLTQTVTGIGLDCASLPCCIPSGIGYQRITWSPTSLPASGFGGYELQRWDQTLTDFETIMLASSSPTVTGFNDYEARVGINSVYRIRILNIYNFAGLWSSQVTGAPPTPGVSGGCADSTGALIFTSNADQSGASNAAYVMQWDGTPDEVFDLAEADEVTFQPMYGRDGRVAFHGTERGLESFNRTLLIQAAAIDPVRLADVKTLRDLAWSNLPYVCVRDDIGDRWYANVRVPAVNARHNRTTYMARVGIVETTTSPFPVDP